MYWFDIAIIYFAFGAPFGVFQITAKREVTLSAFFRMASGYLLWPLIAIQGAARFLFTKPTAQKDEIEFIRTELESAIFSNSASSDLYAFREVFYRYTGLAKSIAEFRTQYAEFGGFHSSLITNHSSLIRSACLTRRDRRKLNSQLATARQDFVEMMDMAKISEIDHVVVKLANFFDDKTLVDTFHSR